jgi:hypothetical protein
MPRALPPRPNLDQLKHQAKDVLKAHRSGDAAGCAVLRCLPLLARCSDAELLAARATLNDAQHALAQDYGFQSWAALKRFVERAVPLRYTPEEAPLEAKLAESLRVQVTEVLGTSSKPTVREQYIVRGEYDLTEPIVDHLRLSTLGRCTGKPARLTVGHGRFELTSETLRFQPDAAPVLDILMAGPQGQDLGVRLRLHLTADSTGADPGQTGLPSFLYVGLERDGSVHEGTVKARDLMDASARVRSQFRMPISLRREGSSAVGDATQEAAACTLLFTFVDGGSQAIFDCAGAAPSVQLWIEELAGDFIPLPKHVMGHRLLEVLQQLGEAPGLGRGDAIKRIRISLDRFFPGEHVPPFRVEFRSTADKPLRITAAILKPTDRGQRVQLLPQIADMSLAAIAETPGETVHVLTRTREQADYLALELARRLGAEKVAQLNSKLAELPQAPVIVGQVSDVCFTYIRVRAYAPERVEEFERGLSQIRAVVVDIDWEVDRTPCQIKADDGGILGEMLIRPMLMMYRELLEVNEDKVTGAVKA